MDAQLITMMATLQQKTIVCHVIVTELLTHSEILLVETAL